MSVKTNKVLLISVGLTLFALIILNNLVRGDWGDLTGGFANLIKFWNTELWPPEWSLIFEAQAEGWQVFEKSHPCRTSVCHVERFASQSYRNLKCWPFFFALHCILSLFKFCIFWTPFAAQNGARTNRIFQRSGTKKHANKWKTNYV